MITVDQIQFRTSLFASLPEILNSVIEFRAEERQENMQEEGINQMGQTAGYDGNEHLKRQLAGTKKLWRFFVLLVKVNF